jgi:lipid-binding SYLF domain-containing protein
MKLIIKFIVLLLLNTSVQAQSLNNKINNAVQSMQDSIRDVVETSASEIDKDANTALTMLREEISDSSLIIDQAYGYLVFPRIVKVGVGIGIETGEGVLRINDLSVDYYRLSSGSLGFQLGAQAKGVVVAFMTQDILNNFRNNPGWKVGVDGSITIIDQGLGKSIDTDNILDPIVAFVFDNRGLMYSLTMEGTIFNLISK